MLLSFLKHYLELPEKKKKIVCLGGGVGTAQILKGLRPLYFDLTAVVSMADDGGSAGRLRRAFSVPPPGDIVNCLAALSSEESILRKLFIYRFSGPRYGQDTDLGGQKLGNLIFVALADIYKGDTNKALEEFSRIISSGGRVLPATIGDVNIWAKTASGKKVIGEANIDLGKYDGNHTLEKVFLDPSDVKTYKPTGEAIDEADMIVVGPGDLFSTILPVLIVPGIKSTLKRSAAKKVFIINIANKPYETPNFKASDYLAAVKNHLLHDIFDTIIVNINQRPKIPKNLRYKYVAVDTDNLARFKGQVIKGDFVDQKYPLHHDSDKIANAIARL